MHSLTRTFILRWSYVHTTGGADAMAASSYDSLMEHTYARLLLRPPALDDKGRGDEEAKARASVYEACRLAALIYTRSIVQGAALADSGDVVHARPTAASMHVASAPHTPAAVAHTVDPLFAMHHLTPPPSARLQPALELGPEPEPEPDTSTTLLAALHAAVAETEPARCWDKGLGGVFLWICLVGGSAAAAAADPAADYESPPPSSRSWDDASPALVSAAATLVDEPEALFAPPPSASADAGPAAYLAGFHFVHGGYPPPPPPPLHQPHQSYPQAREPPAAPRRDASVAWMRKWFSLHAVRAAVALGFADPVAVVEAQRTMLRVLAFLRVKGGEQLGA